MPACHSGPREYLNPENLVIDDLCIFCTNNQPQPHKDRW